MHKRVTRNEQLFMPFVVCFLAVAALVAMHYNPDHAAQIIQLISILAGCIGAIRIANRARDDNDDPSRPQH